jgi:hypothetical protein
MTATALIADFSETVTVTRPGAGAYTNGTWTPGSSSSFSIEISLQPVQGEDLQILTEAERTRRVMKGYTVTRLYTARESTDQKPDRVAYDGEAFEVHNVERWRGDLNYYKVLLVKADT